jgi:hypothetical protein
MDNRKQVVVMDKMLEDMVEVQAQVNLVFEAADKHPSFFHKKTALINYLMIFIQKGRVVRIIWETFFKMA